MNKAKAALVIGGTIAAFVGTVYVVNAARTKYAPVQVQLIANPVPAPLLIDGKQVTSPATVSLPPGIHTLQAPTKNQNFYVTYGFDRWTLNGKTVSYTPTASILITAPAVLKAEYIIAQSGRYPLLTL